MAGVRMAEMAISANPGDELMALGLGSCIGLAIVDRTAGVAGLAHIVLPESPPNGGPPGKFADLAVPELVALLRRAGAVERRFETAIVGGARMFAMSGGLDIGSRNEQAVRAALAKLRIPVRAAQTGGNQGRTVRIAVGEGLVTVRAAGNPAVTLLEGRSGTRPAPPRESRSPRSGSSSVSQSSSLRVAGI
jgi:chemotaxis protein CheD